MKMCPILYISSYTYSVHARFFPVAQHDPLEATNLKSRFMSYLIASIATETKCVLHHYYHVCVHSLDCFRGVATPATPPLDPALGSLECGVLVVYKTSTKIILCTNRYLEIG